MTDSSENSGDAFVALMLGVIFGLLLAAFLTSNKAKCPFCQRSIKRGQNPCPHCNSFLRWTQ